MDFPWRKHTSNELKIEYKRLVDKINNDSIREFPISLSRIGFKCTNFFFQYERMRTPGIGRPSTIEYWKKNKKNIIKFSKKEKRDYFSTLNYFNHSPSQFPIVTSGKLYRLFKAKKILDPYSGWGDRCLAAMSLNLEYIGIDSNPNLLIPYTNLINFYNNSNCNIKFINDKCENINIEKYDFDFVFSSPPFWKNTRKDGKSCKMIERYNNIEVNRDEFMKNSLIPIFKKCINKAEWTCFYIPNDMYDELKNIKVADKVITFKVNNTKIHNIYCWKKSS